MIITHEEEGVTSPNLDGVMGHPSSLHTQATTPRGQHRPRHPISLQQDGLVGSQALVDSTVEGGVISFRPAPPWVTTARAWTMTGGTGEEITTGLHQGLMVAMGATACHPPSRMGGDSGDLPVAMGKSPCKGSPHFPINVAGLLIELSLVLGVYRDRGGYGESSRQGSGYGVSPDESWRARPSSGGGWGSEPSRPEVCTSLIDIIICLYFNFVLSWFGLIVESGDVVSRHVVSSPGGGLGKVRRACAAASLPCRSPYGRAYAVR